MSLKGKKILLGITGGIAASKQAKYQKYVSYKPTSRLLKMWWAKQKTMKKKAIAGKLAYHTHSSVKEILKTTMPYIQFIFKNNKKEEIFCSTLTDQM